MKKKNILFLAVPYLLMTSCSIKRNLEDNLLLYLPLNGDIKDVGKLKNNTYSYNLAPEKDKNNTENGAFSFEGGGYLAVTDVNNFNNMESFTLSSWVYVNQHKEHNTIFSKCKPMRDFNLQLDSYGHVNTHFAYPDYTHIYSKNTVPLKTWTHIVMVYQNQVFKIYINGKEEETNCFVAGKNGLQKAIKVHHLWTGQDMTIGNLYANGGENFQGNLDEVRVYNKALSAKKIKKLFQHTPPNENKKYPFQEEGIRDARMEEGSQIIDMEEKIDTKEDLSTEPYHPLAIGAQAVYTSTEIEPAFEGNKMGFIPFLQQRITATIKNKYKNHLIVKDTDGEITIIIEKDGSISNIQIYGLDDPTLRNELLEMIRTAPKWKPAIQNGAPTRFYKAMKFNFVIPVKK